MKVKHYIADNMQEAMAKVRNDMGRDAVILHTRRLRKGGILGFFGREIVEVTAANDSVRVPNVQSMPSQPINPVISPLPVNSFPIKEENNKLSVIQMEVAQMRKTLEQLVCGMTKDNRAFPELYQMLIKNDVVEDVADALVKAVQERFSHPVKDPVIIKQFLHSKVVEYLSPVEGIELSKTGPRVVAFVGPTGVGKTTTIAKLAAHFALREHRKVAMITADTYRIAAVDQLKTYAEIIGISVEVVFTPEEMKSALFKHNDKDLILIDTAGRSPKNSYQLNELHALLAVNPYIEVHLVLSATTKYKDTLEIVDSFSACASRKILFTKLDESNTYGTILNLMYLFPSAISYVTTGQNVPDDFELADPYKLASMILRE